MSSAGRLCPLLEPAGRRCWNRPDADQPDREGRQQHIAGAGCDSGPSVGIAQNRMFETWTEPIALHLLVTPP
jgi:hypothetical protein